MYAYETSQIDRVITAEERSAPRTGDDPLYKLTISAAHSSDKTKTLDLGAHELAQIRAIFAKRES